MRISDWSSDVCSSDLEYLGGARANKIGDDGEAGIAKPVEHERQAAQWPFRIRIPIGAGTWLGQHRASDMQVEHSSLVPWSEPFIQVCDMVAQGDYRVSRIPEQFELPAEHQHDDLVRGIGMPAHSVIVQLPRP